MSSNVYSLSSAYSKSTDYTSTAGAVAIPRGASISELHGTDLTTLLSDGVPFPDSLLFGDAGDTWAAIVASSGHSYQRKQLVAKESVADAKRFYRLLESWRLERGFSSSSHFGSLPSYLKIIGMGEKALPFLFSEMETRPDWYFEALECITGVEDLIPEELYGDLDGMSASWLAWGKKNGYI